MIKINLLPHREARRKANKIAFYRWLVLAAMFGGVVVLVVFLYYQAKIADQESRNHLLKSEIAKLDTQIAQIATLKQEIEALKARQQAVEDLQSDRNQPVYLMDEMVKQVPEGVYLSSFTQEGQKVTVVGYAQSNERLSELLRNLAGRSEWLESPNLLYSNFKVLGTGRDSKRVYEFSMNFTIKRPRDKEKAKEKGAAAGIPEASNNAAGAIPKTPAAAPGAASKP